MVPIVNDGAVPSDMKKQSKRGRGSYRLPDSLCNGCVGRNRLLVTGRGVMKCMPTDAHLLCVALSTWTIWNPNGGAYVCLSILSQLIRGLEGTTATKSIHHVDEHGGTRSRLESGR